jgi:tetratricopeptide (TPR) repeat protein
MFDSKQINKVEIEGSNNIVIQGIGGEVFTYNLNEVIDKITEPLKRQIELLESSLSDKTKLYEYSNFEINSLRQELEERLREREELKNKIEEITRQVKQLDPLSIGELHKAALNNLFAGDLEGALAILEDAKIQAQIDALQAKEEQIELEKEEICNTLIFRSQLLMLDGELSMAIESAKKALNVSKKFQCYSHYASLLYHAEFFEESILQLERGLNVTQDEEQRLDLICHKCSILCMLGKYREAEAILLSQSTSSDSVSTDEGRSLLSEKYTLLARIREVFNDYREAAEYLNKAVVIQRDLTIRDRDRYLPSLASNLKRQAKFFVDCNRPDLAGPIYEECRSMFEYLVSVSPIFLHGLASVFNEMGVLYRRLNMVPQAQWFYHSALEICNNPVANTFSVRHLSGNIWNNLGVLFTSIGLLNEGKDALDKALEIRLEMMQVNPEANLPSLIESLTNSATLMMNLEQYEDVAKCCLEGIELLNGKYKDGRKDAALQLKHNLANAYHNIGKFEEARTVITEVIEIKRTLASKNPSVFEMTLARSELLLAGILAELGELTASVAAYDRALEMQKKYQGLNEMEAIHYAYMCAIVARFYQIHISDREKSLTHIKITINSTRVLQNATNILYNTELIVKQVVRNWNLEWDEFLGGVLKEDLQ